LSVNEQLRVLLSEQVSDAHARAIHCERVAELLATASADADPDLVRYALALIRSDKIRRQMEALIERDGPWTAHDINLAPGVQTLGAETEDSRLRRVVQVTADLAGKPLHQLRVLDLGCLEGQFALEFALHGSQVVAIEGRETNLRKAKFAARMLGIRDLDLRLADVRDLNEADYGSFDVVLCLGILYHLDAPDVMEFVRAMADVCQGLLIIDAHYSLKPRFAVDWNGNRYWGDIWAEYADGSRAEDEEQALWSSIGNDRSFLLTRSSLCNLLRHCGFTSVHECLNPYECHSSDWPVPSRTGDRAEWPDRSTFVAVKGHRETLITSPLTDTSAEQDRPERPKYLQPIRPHGYAVLRALRRRASAASRRLLGLP
jgi:2-polyprenyl-3-methyl-5-hydroxy-6-metoxy-1,4-benzoquinol methylase